MARPVGVRFNQWNEHVDTYRFDYPPITLEIKSESARLLDAARRCLTSLMTGSTSSSPTTAVFLRLTEASNESAFGYENRDKLVLYRSESDGFVYRQYASGFSVQNGMSTFLEYDEEQHCASGTVSRIASSYDVGCNCLAPLLNHFLNERGWFLIHAAGVAQDEAGILLIGSSGSGKSTTSALLARNGFDMLHDDQIPVPVHLADVNHGSAFGELVDAGRVGQGRRFVHFFGFIFSLNFISHASSASHFIGSFGERAFWLAS